MPNTFVDVKEAKMVTLTGSNFTALRKTQNMTN